MTIILTGIYRLEEERVGEPQADVLKGEFKEVSSKFGLRNMKGYKFYSDRSSHVVAREPPNIFFYLLNGVPAGVTFEYNRTAKAMRILRFGEMLAEINTGE